MVDEGAEKHIPEKLRHLLPGRHVRFTALGGAFIYQINRYSAEERQSILNSTARRAEESTANYMVNQSNVMGFSRELLESSFHLNMMQLAGNLGGVIFVCDTSGQLLLLATDETCLHLQRRQRPIRRHRAGGKRADRHTRGPLLRDGHLVWLADFAPLHPGAAGERRPGPAHGPDLCFPFPPPMPLSNCSSTSPARLF